MPTVSPLLVLRARAEAQAILVGSGDYERVEAIFGLVQWAIDGGLLEQFNEDAIVEIILDPFRRHDDKQA